MWNVFSNSIGYYELKPFFVVLFKLKKTEIRFNFLNIQFINIDDSPFLSNSSYTKSPSDSLFFYIRDIKSFTKIKKISSCCSNWIYNL